MRESCAHRFVHRKGETYEGFNGALAVAGLLLFTTRVHAVEPGPVYSPRVEQGEWEVEWRAFTIVDRKHDEDRLWNHHVALGYGVNSFWWTELVAEYEKPRQESGQWKRSNGRTASS